MFHYYDNMDTAFMAILQAHTSGTLVSAWMCCLLVGLVCPASLFDAHVPLVLCDSLARY